MGNSRTRHDISYMNYTSPDEVIILEMECETCKYKTKEALTCIKYTIKKPKDVLRCEGKCIEYEKKSK